jgi:SAM-dependent methyltransferase
MNQETLTNCPICTSTHFSTHLVCKDYLISQSDFTIQVCNQCGFRFTNPRPDSASIGAYYQSADYVSHNDSGGGLINKVYRLVRQYTLQQKLKLINSLQTKPGKVLDVGCGTGLFLETCQKGGWSINGVEPDANARTVATSRLKIQIKADIDQVVDGEFDLLTMWHVLEHVPDLTETLKKLRGRVRVGGTLLIAVPNSDSLDAHHFQNYWAAYDVPRHLSHFTPPTLKKLVNEGGFIFKEMHPMYFDAFYISMLSTKYRDGRTNWLESIYQGLRSNIRARRTGNYSSLIYVFQKL